jgi:hypothetical protein
LQHMKYEYELKVIWIFFKYILLQK